MPDAALADATARLRAAGCETPRLDAELLLASALGCERVALFTRGAAELEPPAGFEELVQRRADREPVAYILGRREFRRITLRVDPRVLIPRPETELLVEVGLSLPPDARVVDVGTGSGAVALALKHERPDLDVVGTDVSAQALELAQENAAALGLDVSFVGGDLLAGVEGEAVLANLPYVADADPLPPEVRAYEPAEALFAGRDGLAVIRRLVGALPARVSVAAIEVAPQQAEAVAGLLAPWSTQTLRDLAGHDRVVLGQR